MPRPRTAPAAVLAALLLTVPTVLIASPAQAAPDAATLVIRILPTGGATPLEGALHVPVGADQGLPVEYALLATTGLPRPLPDGSHRVTATDAGGHPLTDGAGVPTPAGWYRLVLPRAPLADAPGGLLLTVTAQDPESGAPLLSRFSATGTTPTAIVPTDPATGYPLALLTALSRGGDTALAPGSALVNPGASTGTAPWVLNFTAAGATGAPISRLTPSREGARGSTGSLVVNLHGSDRTKGLTLLQPLPEGPRAGLVHEGLESLRVVAQANINVVMTAVVETTDATTGATRIHRSTSVAVPRDQTWTPITLPFSMPVEGPLTSLGFLLDWSGVGILKIDEVSAPATRTSLAGVRVDAGDGVAVHVLPQDLRADAPLTQGVVQGVNGRYLRYHLKATDLSGETPVPLPLDAATAALQLTAGSETTRPLLIPFQADPTTLLALLPAADAPDAPTLVTATVRDASGVDHGGAYALPKMVVTDAKVADLLDPVAHPLRLDAATAVTTQTTNQNVRFVDLLNGSWGVEVTAPSPYAEQTLVTLLLDGVPVATAPHRLGTNGGLVPGLTVSAADLPKALARTSDTAFTRGRAASGGTLTAAFSAFLAEAPGHPLSAVLTGDVLEFQSLSFVPPGENATATWTFGDGTSLRDRPLDEVVTKSYRTAGTYTTTLTIKTDTGRTATAAQSIPVLNRAPVLRDFIVFPTFPTVTDTIGAIAVVTDPEGAALSYQWFLDGAPLLTTTSSKLTLTKDQITEVTGFPQFEKGSLHTFKVIAKDPLGLSVIHERAFTANDAPTEVSKPAFTYPSTTAPLLIAGEILSVAATVTDRDDAVTAATLRLVPSTGGDATLVPLARDGDTSTWRATFLAPAPGRYTALVEGQNAAGLRRDGAGTLLDVRANRAPTFSLGGSTLLDPGATETYQILSANDPDGRGDLTYRWFLDGILQAATTSTLTVTAPAAMGTHTLIAEATDANGGTTQRSLTYRVDDAITVTLQTTSAGMLDPVTHTARVLDDRGLPVAAATVTFTVLGPGGVPLSTIQVATDSNGEARYEDAGPHAPTPHDVTVEATAASRAGAPRMDPERASAEGTYTPGIDGDIPVLP